MYSSIIPDEIKDIRLTKQEIKECIDIYYHTSDPVQKEKVGLLLVGSHYKYMRMCISQVAPTYVAEHGEELMAECICCFFEKLPAYDPGKNIKLTTYLTPHLKHALVLYIGRMYGDTPYYAQQMLVLKRAIKNLEMAGESYTPETLANGTGLPLTTVTYCLNRMKMEICSYNSDPFFEESICNKDTVPSPEEEVLKKEQLTAIERAKKTLSESENEVISLMYYENYSFTKTAKALEMQVTQVKRIRNSAMAKLRASLARCGMIDSVQCKRTMKGVEDIFVFKPSINREYKEMMQDTMREIDIDF